MTLDSRPREHFRIRGAYDRIRACLEGCASAPGGRPGISPPRTNGLVDCTVQYADIQGSTRIAMETDTMWYAGLVTAFCGETAGVVAEYGGRPVKYVGDGVVSVFEGESCGMVLDCSVAVMEMVHHALGPAAGTPIAAHIGMSHGSVLMLQGTDGVDVLGAPVNLAAKLSTMRRPISMDDSVRSRLGDRNDVAEIRGADWPYGGRVHEYTGVFSG